MKVCTDACIQGALAGREALLKKPQRVLDIGTGTGLLSLMLAQNLKFDRHYAIEINEDAAIQATQNFAASPFEDRILLLQGDIRTYPFQQKFDFIISNPPFYEKALKSPAVSKNQAMHGSHLSYEELLNSISIWLDPMGYCCLMIPYSFTNYLVEKALLKELYLYKIWKIRQTEEHDFFRSILFFSRVQQALLIKELVIKDTTGKYSTDFKTLLQPYYLYL